MMWSLLHRSSVLFVLLIIFIDKSDCRKLLETMNRPFNNSVLALLVFGDSTVDSGNNNYIHTVFKGNFPPYGMDFANRIPTGRFSDGRLVTDLLASYAGVKKLVPAYLDPKLSVEELMTGVSFASAVSGFDPLTPRLSGALSLEKQLDYLKEYKGKLEVAIGKEKTKNVVSKSIFVLSGGTNDFVLNYFATLPSRRKTYNATSYQRFLLRNVKQIIQGLREEGAGLIAVVGLPPIGCLPIVMTLFPDEASGIRRCNTNLSSVALDYNRKLQKTLKAMEKPTSPLVYVDSYKSLNDMIHNPSKFGFDEVSTGCCGSGLVEASFMCNQKSKVCDNPSKYVFFDSVHPTEATYKYLFKDLRPVIDRVIRHYA